MKKLTTRTLNRITWGDLESADLDPTTIVIGINSGSAAGKSIDIGSLCYKHRKPAIGNRCNYVDISSLQNDRKDAILRLANYLLSTTSSATAYAYYTKVVYFFNFIDTNEISIDFTNEDQLIDAYEQLTDQLINRMQQSEISGSKISRTHAAAIQLRCADFIALVLDKHTVEIQASCTRIDQSGKTGKLPAPFDNQKRAVATHLAIFNAIADFLMKEKSLPLIIEAENTKVIYYSSAKQTNPAVALACEENFLEWEDVLNKAEKLGIDLHTNYNTNRTTWKAFKKSLDKFEDNHLYWRETNLANKAITAFQLAFIAVTTGNSSVVFDLEMDETGSAPTVPSKGKRLTGTKARAKYKKVPLEFGLRFKPQYDKYIEFRSWLLKKLSLDTSLTFFYLAENDDNDSKTSAISKSSTRRISAYKSFFKKYFPNTPWIPPSQLRKGGGDFFLTDSGNPIITAQKLGNTVSTVLMHYSATSFEKASHELTIFFNAMRDRVIRETRIHDDLIPVKIVDSGGSRTSVAHCEAPSSPQLADGFSAAAPVPSCNQPESCLFCEHFLIHADIEDVRRLLSFKEVLTNTISKTLNHDHFNNVYSPVFYRIDEILWQVANHLPQSPGIIEIAQQEIAQGQLDEFWGIHYDFLVDVGYIQ